LQTARERERDADRADACLIKRHIVDWAGAVRKREMQGERSREGGMERQMELFRLHRFFQEVVLSAGENSRTKNGRVEPAARDDFHLIAWKDDLSSPN